ncbi:MAG: hypothetical protein ABW352_12940 [Polyangiales bacterium]
MNRLTTLTLTLTLTATATATASPALAWEWFRSQSSAIERGNEALAKGQHQEALEAYDEAALKLPNDPAVQLDRGLALLGLDKLGEAREAFRRAGAASAPKDVRGPALYDLGLAFMKEADMAGQAEDLDGANKMLQESVDAFRGSLRAQPNNPDAAWNLELAKRRLVDNEQKREQKKKDEEQKKDQQDQEPNKDQENKDPDQQQQQPDAGSNQDGDAGTPKPDDKDGDQGEQDPQDAGQPEPEPQGGQGDAGQPPPQPEPEPQDQKPQPPQQPEANELPEHMKRALDSLEAGEENLEKQRAKQRARQRPRRIEKDW